MAIDPLKIGVRREIKGCEQIARAPNARQQFVVAQIHCGYLVIHAVKPTQLCQILYPFQGTYAQTVTVDISCNKVLVIVHIAVAVGVKLADNGSELSVGEVRRIDGKFREPCIQLLLLCQHTFIIGPVVSNCFVFICVSGIGRRIGIGSVGVSYGCVFGHVLCFRDGVLLGLRDIFNGVCAVGRIVLFFIGQCLCVRINVGKAVLLSGSSLLRDCIRHLIRLLGILRRHIG